MGSVGAPELIVIFLVALIVLGPERLPKAARQVGRAVAEFKKVTSGFQDEVRKAIDIDGDNGTGATANTATAAPATATPAGAYGGQPSGTASTADVDLPPPPDDPSRN